MVVLGIFLSTALLIAGGDAGTNLSNVADIPAKVCKENQVYIEKDVQLMWQDQAYTNAEEGAYKREHSIGKAGRWDHAKKYCERLHYAGYADWRLPTSDEMIHVHNKEGQVFTYFRDGDFWSSTPTREGRYYAVYPADAQQYPHQRKQSNYIRCVRCMAE